MKFRAFLIGFGAAAIGSALLVRRLAPERIAFDTLDPEKALNDGSRFVDLRGLRVRTRSGGEGSPAIVLLHGFAASVFTWHKVFDAFCEIGTTIAFDRPAFGLTSRPLQFSQDGNNPYSLDAQVGLTIAVLDHFGVERAVLVGHSAGGTVAIATALKHPERIDSLILVSPAVYIDIPSPAWLGFLIESSLMRSAGPWIARFLARFAYPIMDRAWHDRSLITPEIRRAYVQSFEVHGWDRGMWEVVRANRPPRLAAQIRSLQIRTLVVTGDDDRIVPTRQSVRLARELPNAELRVIPRCGHIPQEERPEQFLAAIRPFIHDRAGGPV